MEANECQNKKKQKTNKQKQKMKRNEWQTKSTDENKQKGRMIYNM